MQKKYRVIDKAGLHARPASLLVGAANKFQEEINLLVDDKSINCKSIMSLMGAGIMPGAEVKLEVSSENAEEIFKAIEAVIVNENVVEVV